MAPDGRPQSRIHRQLAPTVGPATSGVSFREGILGGIGEIITVETAVFGESGGYIVDNDSYMPANNYLVSACIFPTENMASLGGVFIWGGVEEMVVT